MRLGPTAFIALLALTSAGACAATVTGFDGRSTSVAALPALTDLDSVMLGSGPLPVINGPLGVLLVDGSWLPAEAILADGKPDRLRVRSPYGVLDLPLEAVAGWGAELPSAPEKGDVVVVESGLLAGRVQRLSDGHLTFRTDLDPEPLSLALSDIRAARLGNPVRRSSGLRLRAPASDPGRPALDLVVMGDGLALAAAPQVRLPTSAFGAMVLRVEGGRRVYLSDLAPGAVREDGMFGVVWPFSRDLALDGSPLRLGGVVRAKGLVVHSVATLRWELAAAYVRLRADAGISDSVAPEGDCVAILRGDGRELWRARVRGSEPLRRLDLDLSGVQALELTVEAGERFDIGDHLALGDAQLIRKP